MLRVGSLLLPAPARQSLPRRTHILHHLLTKLHTVIAQPTDAVDAARCVHHQTSGATQSRCPGLVGQRAGVMKECGFYNDTYDHHVSDEKGNMLLLYGSVLAHSSVPNW
jgi:hypothetical protein